MSLGHRVRAAGGRRGGRRLAPDRGETLVELLMTVALMGVAFLAILTALFTAGVSTATTAQRTRMSVALQAWGEQAISPKDADGKDVYEACDPDFDAPPKIKGEEWTSSGTNTWTNDSGWEAELTVEYLEVPDNPGAADFGTPSFAACTEETEGSITRDERAQRLTLTMSTPPGNTQYTDGLVVDRRDARCPTHPEFDNPDQGPC